MKYVYLACIFLGNPEAKLVKVTRWLTNFCQSKLLKCMLIVWKPQHCPNPPPLDPPTPRQTTNYNSPLTLTRNHSFLYLFPFPSPFYFLSALSLSFPPPAPPSFSSSNSSPSPLFPLQLFPFPSLPPHSSLTSPAV